MYMAYRIYDNVGLTQNTATDFLIHMNPIKIRKGSKTRRPLGREAGRESVP
jgi:hypothetical protein